MGVGGGRGFLQRIGKSVNTSSKGKAETLAFEEFNGFLPPAAGTTVVGPEEFNDFLLPAAGTTVAGPEEFDDFV